MSDLVLTEDHGRVRHVVLNRPEKRNAFNAELIAALTAALREIAADPSVHVVLLRGAGPMLSSGIDLKELASFSGGVEMLRPFRRAWLDVCALLESGKNVATPSFLFHPRRIPEADRIRLQAACDNGNSTIHGSGLNPGNLSGVLPLALSGMSRTIDQIKLQERADWTLWDSTEITFDGMWFGRPTDEVTPTANKYLSFLTRLFVE